MSVIRKTGLAIAAMLPNKLKLAVYSKIFGYEINPTARIGLSFIDAKTCRIGEGTRIGHFNAFRNLDSLEIGHHSSVGVFNWIAGYSPIPGREAFMNNPRRRSCLKIGDHTSITHRHILDCSDALEIGSFTTIAGWRSQILTHSIDIEEGVQASSPTTIGDYCFIGTSSNLLMGSSLPLGCVVYAGTTARIISQEPYGLYRGNPCTRVKTLSPDARYFGRQKGRVS